MRQQTYLVSDAEVEAAMNFLGRASDLAGREQPIPPSLMRCILEEAAMVRTGIKRAPTEEVGGQR